MIDVRLAIEKVFTPSPVPAVPLTASAESFSPVTLHPHDERTATERPAWNLKADVRVDRHGLSGAIPAPRTASSRKAGQPRSCTLTLGIAFTMLAALGTGVYLFRSERALSPVENPQTASELPDVEQSFMSDSVRLKLDADEVLAEIVELKNDDPIADESVWKRAESVEALGRQAYDAQDYETANRRFQTALEVYQSALSEASPAGREETARTAQTAANADRRAILAALAEYEKALETKDLALFRTVKPNLTAKEEQGLEEGFRRTDRQEIELKVDEIVIQGEEATARVTRSDRLVVQGAQQQGEDRKQTFRFRKDGSRWVLVEIGP
jgi:hypothetical protein